MSKRLRAGFKLRVEKLVEQGVQLGLAVILVGENPASKVYVGNKVRACEECGVASFHHAFPLDSSESAVLATLAGDNRDRSGG